MMNILMCAGLLVLSFAAQAAEPAVSVGKVGYMSGTLVAQRADGTIKVMGPKSEVLEGDMLITAKDSYAQVQLNDGAKMTLRPHSNLKIDAFSFNRDKPAADNAVMRLLKGGFRTVTGLIGKRGNPDAYKLRAASATIGIRGTDFSTRICATKGCADDETPAAKSSPPTLAAQSQVVGRVMLVNGELTAKDASGKVRKLALGGPVYEGDLLGTSEKGHSVVAFRDGGRITLQKGTVFHVEKFKYKQADVQENAVLRLLKGSVRVVTGLIGRVNHDNYDFKVANATIGIRGTGFDAWCNGPCASGAANPGATEGDPLNGAGVYVWAGEVVLVSPGGSFIVAIQQAAIIARDTGKPVPIQVIPRSIMENNAPKPDTIPGDVEKLFGAEASEGDPGLYVTVHDGHVILVQGENKIDLGRGETGFGNNEVLSRLASAPAFMSTGDSEINSGGGNSNPNPSLNQGGCVVR
ncbi:MAG: FecR domain-containing protein [Gallionella sp.]|nr:FecR domain-containing protein [Gallionella sp.]